MPLFVNNSRIVNVHKGNDRIYRIYKGSDLIWRAYKTNEVVFEGSTSSNYSFDILTPGLFQITIIGAGGGGCGNGAKGSSYSAATGGAGAGLILNVELPRKRLDITIGGGGKGTGGGDYQGGAAGTGGATRVSLDNEMIGVCNGGTGGRAWFRGGYSAGSGGSYSTGSYIKEIITQTNGPNGTAGNANDYLYTCAVPISGIQAGNGGAALGASYSYKWRGDNGSNGYVKVQFLSEI